MRSERFVIVAMLLTLGACSDGAQTTDRSAGDHAGDNVRSALPEVSAPASPVPAARLDTKGSSVRSCAAQIGAAAAKKRVDVCRDVSPATHPPCNAANSCALIEDEIARSCALFDDDGAPMKGCDTDPKGSQAAADVVRRYYSAIDARDYATAWTQWGDDGRPGQTLAAFERGFDHTRSTHVSVGALKPAEGGAGSIYQEVPVTVEATLDDGTRQRFTGTYVIRRVNGVDGASASQLRWHIDSAVLKPASGS